VTTSATLAARSPQQWLDLTDHLAKWFYQPDLEALEVVLSVAYAHYACEADPIWLFLIGPSGSGKTEICINAVSDLPQARILGDLTTRSFLSFWKGDRQGILIELGASGLLLFKDFTTILSKCDQERMQIAAQLREIYDGKFGRDTGANKYLWEGKMTTIAASTPYLERLWGVKRELGERFLTVRWPRTGSVALARKAAQQRGHEVAIRKRTRELGRALIQSVSGSPRLSPLPPEMDERVSALSEILAICRTNVIRDSGGKREIIDIPNIEEPGRIHKALAGIVWSHATLWHRDPCEDDLRLAVRVAWDSIPPVRRLLLREFKSNIGLSPASLSKATSIPRSTIVWHAEELCALNVLRVAYCTSEGDSEYEPTDDFTFLLEMSHSKLG
jgi:hypothetical protein